MAKYQEVADDLRRRIQSGEIRPGEKLPHTSDLVEQYGFSKETIRAAIDLLAGEGLVRTVKRLGTVVQPVPTERRRIKRGLMVMRDPARGYVFPAASRPDEPWAVHGRPRRAYVPAPVAVAETFGIEAGTDILRRRRVTSPAGEAPFQIVDTWISPEGVRDAPKVADESTGPGGYLDRLEESGHGPIGWQETTRTRMPSSEEAQLLEISKAVPVMEMTLVGTSGGTGRAVEVTVRVIPGDRVELVSDFRRDASAAWPREEESTE